MGDLLRLPTAGRPEEDWAELHAHSAFSFLRGRAGRRTWSPRPPGSASACWR